jgi:hypothetical protein
MTLPIFNLTFLSRTSSKQRSTQTTHSWPSIAKVIHHQVSHLIDPLHKSSWKAFMIDDVCPICTEKHFAALQFPLEIALDSPTDPCRSCRHRYSHHSPICYIDYVKHLIYFKEKNGKTLDASEKRLQLEHHCCSTKTPRISTLAQAQVKRRVIHLCIFREEAQIVQSFDCIKWCYEWCLVWLTSSVLVYRSCFQRWTSFKVGHTHKHAQNKVGPLSRAVVYNQLVLPSSV